MAERHGYSIEIGPDGFPVDPENPINAWIECVEGPVQLHRRYLRRCESGWRSGVVAALIDAVEYCTHNTLPPLPWIADGVRALGSNSILPKRPGRGSYTEDMKDYVRFIRVFELMIGLNPPTWEESYWRVSEELEGTEYAGAPDTIKKSYQRVKKRMSKNLGRYYVSESGAINR